jgi:hypothetical protein
MVLGGFLDHFVVKFDHGFAHDVEDCRPCWCQVIIAPAAWSTARLRLTSQPSRTLHAFQQRVQRARADVIPMSSELAQNPLTNDWMLRGVMKDVHLPETEQDFACEELAINARHWLHCRRQRPAAQEICPAANRFPLAWRSTSRRHA